jgi:dTMP kinase
MTTRGRFVVLEGLDGAGTSTQQAALRAWLAGRGHEVELTREPTDGPIGSVIRQVLLGRLTVDAATMALLFAADRTDHLFNAVDGVTGQLEAGRWVVSDRYVLSSLAYQAATGVDRAWVAAINARAVVPDVTIFVETPVEVCLERIARRSSRDELYHKGDLLRRVAAEYERLFESVAPTGHLIRVSGTGSPDEVTGRVVGALAEWLGA